MNRTEFTAITAYLAAAVGKPMPAEQIEVYFSLLGDLSAQVLWAAAKQAILENQYPTIPPVGVLRKLATEAMNGAEITRTADEAWGLVVDAIRMYGWPNPEAGKASLPPLVRKAVECFHWQDLCDASNPEVVRAQFRKAYEAIAEREKRQALQPIALKDSLAAIANKRTDQVQTYVQAIAESTKF